MKYFWAVIGFIACLFGIFYIFNATQDKRYIKKVDKEIDKFINDKKIGNEDCDLKEDVTSDNDYVVTYKGRKYARLVK